MNSALPNPAAVPRQCAGVPWVPVLIIGAIFFVTGHDLFYSKVFLERGALGYIVTFEEADVIVQQYETGRLQNAIAYACLGLFGLMGILRAAKRPLQINGFFSLLVIFFVGWSILSVAWSDAPKITAKNIVIFLALCTAVIGFTKHFTRHEIVLFTVAIMSTYILIGLAAEIAIGVFRPWVAGYRFSGTCHPNGQALNCGLLTLAALYMAGRDPSRKRMYLFITLAAFIGLVFTKSRTSLLAVIIAPIIFRYLASSSIARMRIAVFGIAFICFMLLTRDSVLAYIMEKASLGRIDTNVEQLVNLTGRTDLWAALLKYYVPEHPFIGFGFNSFWTLEHMEEIRRLTDMSVASTHNVFFEVLVSLGYIGLLAYLIFNLAAVRQSVRYAVVTRDEEYAFLGTVIIFSLIHGLTESTFIFASAPSFIVLVMIAHLAFHVPPRAAMDSAAGVRRPMPQPETQEESPVY